MLIPQSKRNAKNYIVKEMGFLMIASLNTYHFGNVIYRFEWVGLLHADI